MTDSKYKQINNSYLIKCYQIGMSTSEAYEFVKNFVWTHYWNEMYD